jgi:hypothetical protein
MNQLINEGYYIGKNSELFSDLDTFKMYCSLTSKLSENKNNFVYRFEYQNSILPYPMFIKEEEIKNRENFIKENNLSIFQRWWQYDGNELIPMINYFRKNITDFVNKKYGDLGELSHLDNVTLFENNDFIKIHKDGQDENRICVFLIYLSNIETYNDGGGKLIIKNELVSEEVYPTNENFVILDFTKNNMTHEVTPVKNNFKRITYINFISKKN